MPAEEKVILYSSPEAARFETGISGWVDRHGRYWGTGPAGEHMARYSGSTHQECESCGAIIPRASYCRDCATKKEIEKYNAMPKKKWDGTGMLYSQAADRWWEVWEDALEYCLEHDCTLESLRLIICRPVYAWELDGTEIYSDHLPEDAQLEDVDPDLAALFDEINKHVRESKVVLSWEPGEFAVDLLEEE